MSTNLNIEKAKNTKKFKTMNDRFLKVCEDGDSMEITEFLKKNIIPVSPTNFKRKAPVLDYFTEEAFREEKITLEQYKAVKDIISKKINHAFLEPVIDFKTFFQDYNDLIENIKDEEITKDTTLALVATPILYCSHAINCLDIRYLDLELSEVSSGLLLTYADKKGSKNILIVENIENTYKKVLQSLKKNYGEDAYVFPESPEKSWALMKTGKILYRSYKKYIKNKNEYVQESSFITLLKRILKEQQANYYKEF